MKKKYISLLLAITTTLSSLSLPVSAADYPEADLLFEEVEFYEMPEEMSVAQDTESMETAIPENSFIPIPEENVASESDTSFAELDLSVENIHDSEDDLFSEDGAAEEFEDSVNCAEPSYPESEHPYQDNTDCYWNYSLPGAASLEVVFSDQTKLEEPQDYLVIYSGVTPDAVEIGRYTGDELSGATLYMPGDSICILLHSNESFNDYGFSLDSISEGAAIDNSILLKDGLPVESILNMGADSSTEESRLLPEDFSGEDTIQLEDDSTISDAETDHAENDDSEKPDKNNASHKEIVMTKSSKAGSANFQLNSTNVTLYAMDSTYQQYISIPSNYRKEFTLKVSGADSPQFQVISGNSVKVDQNGKITNRVYYWYGNIGYFNKIDGREPDSTSPIFGESTIQVTAGGQSINVTVNVINYAEIYADKIIDKWISEKVTPGMTDYQKIEESCKMAASYDYSVYASGAISMIIKGGGDCWASTDLIIRFCKKLGYEAWARNGNKDAGAGSGHINALVKANGVYYEAEAGYNQKAPRYYSLKERDCLFSYKTDSTYGGLKIYQYDGEKTDTLIIPDKINGKPVVSIDKTIMGNSSKVKEIVLPNTLKSLEDFAFSGNEYLQKINLPASLQNIGSGVFAQCTSLTNITLDYSNPYFTIQNGAIYDKKMTRLISVPAAQTLTLPASVTTIAPYACYYNSNLVSVSMTRVTAIEEGAFGDCSNLKSIELGSSLARIDNFAFADTPIKSLKVPDCLNQITEHAFTYSSIQSLVGTDAASGAKNFCKNSTINFVNVNHTHEYETTVLQEPNYRKEGVEEHTCKHCYESYNVSIPKLEIPKLTFTLDTDYVHLSWGEKNEWKHHYEICYRRTEQSSWTTYSITRDTKYDIDRDYLCDGDTYFFAVRDVNEDELFDKNAVEVTPPTCPVLNTVSYVKNGVSLKWESVKGVKKYRVYRATKNWNYTPIAITSDCNYVDTSVKSGTTYTYTVCCMDDSGKVPTSGYTRYGITTPYFSAPKLNSVSNSMKGVVVKWDSVPGAQAYKVFRKTGNNSWKPIQETTKNTFTDTTVKGGTTYTYTVRCIDYYDSSYTSAYDTKGLTVKYIQAPSVTSLKNTKSGVKLTWNSCTGAETYTIFRKIGSSGWSKIGNVKGTQFTDQTAVSGKTYLYTVRCANSTGTTYTSAYISSGWKKDYLASPVTKAAKSGKNIVITWSKVNGAAKYKVFRKEKGGSWKALGYTTSLKYTDSTAVSGKTYCYAVRAMNGSNSSAYITSKEIKR